MSYRDKKKFQPIYVTFTWVAPSKVHYLTLAQCSQLYIHPAASSPWAHSSSPCSYTWRKCTGTLVPDKNIVSSTFSSNSSLERTDGCRVRYQYNLIKYTETKIYFHDIHFQLAIHVLNNVEILIQIQFPQNTIKTYPQCFRFCGLSILTAILILRLFSGEFFGTCILYHSGICNNNDILILIVYSVMYMKCH